MMAEVYPDVKKGKSEKYKRAKFIKLSDYTLNLIANPLQIPTENQFMVNGKDYSVKVNNPTLCNKLYKIINT